MQQTYKQRARSSRDRATAEVIDLPTEPLTDTDDAADLIETIDQLLEG